MRTKIIFSFLIGVMVGILITSTPVVTAVTSIANVSIPLVIVVVVKSLFVFVCGVVITTGIGRLLSGPIVIGLFMEWEQRRVRAIIINSVMVLCAIGLLFLMKKTFYEEPPMDSFTALFAVREYLPLSAALLMNGFGSVVGIVLVNKIPVLRSFVLL